MTAEFEAKRQQSADELARIQRRCDEELAERQARCDSIVNDLNKQIEQLKEERRELLEITRLWTVVFMANTQVVSIRWK